MGPVFVTNSMALAKPLDFSELSWTNNTFPTNLSNLLSREILPLLYSLRCVPQA